MWFSVKSINVVRRGTTFDFTQNMERLWTRGEVTGYGVRYLQGKRQIIPNFAVFEDNFARIYQVLAFILLKTLIKKLKFLITQE